MALLLELSQILLTTFAFTLMNPFFWVVILLVTVQYQRVARLEKKLFGKVINRVWPQVRNSVGLGLAGGLLASALLLLFGLSLEQIGLTYIWLVAILLFLINPRFLCFAYAGGIVALAVILLRGASSFFPELAGLQFITQLLKIHIPSMLLLIALLHLIEALLIYLGGHRGSSPVYFKNRHGDVVGGFTLQRFWPLPLVALLVTVVLQAEAAGVNMPGWWPIIKSTLEPGFGQTLQYMAVPVVAGLGYTDLALSSTPREKSLLSARHLALYSFSLLGMGVAAEYFPLFTLPAVLLAPLGHELLIIYGKHRESSRAFRYTPVERGVRLMMVLPGSSAEQAGLREGDIILRVNGAGVVQNKDLMDLIESSYFMVLLEGERRDGSVFSTVLNKRAALAKRGSEPGGEPLAITPAVYSSLFRGAELGLILTPSSSSPVYVEVKRHKLSLLLPRLFAGRKKK